MLESLRRLDLELFTLINQRWRSAWLDDTMHTLSTDPLFWGLIAGAGVAYFCIKGRKGIIHLWLPVVMLGLSVGTADLSANITKTCISRIRPHNCLPNAYYEKRGHWRQNPADFQPIREGGSSFYSGHATNSMALAATLAVIVPQLSPVIYILPLSVGYSRVYLGKHYPSDVLVGWLTGLLIGRGYGALYRYCRRRLELRGVVFPAILG